jgi:hypothetical protein
MRMAPAPELPLRRQGRLNTHAKPLEIWVTAVTPATDFDWLAINCRSVHLIATGCKG